MRFTSRRLSTVAAFLLPAAWITASCQNSQPTPPAQNHAVIATRLYTGADGQSHIDQVPIVLQGAPREDSAAIKMSDAYVVRGAPGMFESWHNADEKRYIVVISGEA